MLGPIYTILWALSGFLYDDNYKEIGIDPLIIDVIQDNREALKKNLHRLENLDLLENALIHALTHERFTLLGILFVQMIWRSQDHNKEKEIIEELLVWIEILKRRSDTTRSSPGFIDSLGKIKKDLEDRLDVIGNFMR